MPRWRLDHCNIFTPPILFRTAAKRRTRLLFAGLDHFSSSPQIASKPQLQIVPFAQWVADVDKSRNIQEDDFDIIQVASGATHSLIHYRLHGLENIFAIGGNDMGQLRSGF